MHLTHNQTPGHKPHVVTLPEEFDLTVSDRVWRRLDTILTPGALLILDCGQVTFTDSCGLRVLVLAHRTARQREARLHLAHIPTTLRRLLDLAGITHLFTPDTPQPPPAAPTGHHKASAP